MEMINGKLLKDMLASGANNLSNKFTEIDALNVFPVPDGDTGTNMSLTFNAGVKDALACTSDDVCDIAKVLSKGLLMGARGNSGVITSQIFRGLYQGVDGMKEINGFQLANALVMGSRVAYKAVMRPVEGTMEGPAAKAAAHGRTGRTPVVVPGRAGPVIAGAGAIYAVVAVDLVCRFQLVFSCRKVAH